MEPLIGQCQHFHLSALPCQAYSPDIMSCTVNRNISIIDFTIYPLTWKA